jgi:hypothetical protein
MSVMRSGMHGHLQHHHHAGIHVVLARALTPPASTSQPAALLRTQTAGAPSRGRPRCCDLGALERSHYRCTSGRQQHIMSTSGVKQIHSQNCSQQHSRETQAPTGPPTMAKPQNLPATSTSSILRAQAATERCCLHPYLNAAQVRCNPNLHCHHVARGACSACTCSHLARPQHMHTEHHWLSLKAYARSCGVLPSR